MGIVTADISVTLDGYGGWPEPAPRGTVSATSTNDRVHALAVRGTPPRTRAEGRRQLPKPTPT